MELRPVGGCPERGHGGGRPDEGSSSDGTLCRRGSMMLSLYRSAAWLATPFLRRHLARRIALGKEERGRIDERCGLASLPRPAGRLGWLHAASVGETQSLLPL